MCLVFVKLVFCVSVWIWFGMKKLMNGVLFVCVFFVVIFIFGCMFGFVFFSGSRNVIVNVEFGVSDVILCSVVVFVLCVRYMLMLVDMMIVGLLVLKFVLMSVLCYDCFVLKFIGMKCSQLGMLKLSLIRWCCFQCCGVGWLILNMVMCDVMFG